MKLGSFEFSFRELSGSLGDFGTLLPLAIGYIVVNGLNPAGFLVSFGLINIVTGLVYRIPMPLQPMKVIAAMAIANAWAPGQITGTAFAMGVFWLVLSLTPLAARLMELTPESVIRGVQVTLGISLAWQGISLVANDSWLLGIATLVFILLASWGEAKRPTALVVVAGGLFLMWRSGTLPAWNGLQFALPSVQAPSVVEAWWGFWHAGLAQVPLTLTNAVMAVALLIKDYFPDRQVKERRLMLNTGLMNLGASFLGGFPICHGAGGLAGQYYYGARTGGANIMEGVIEVFLGAFMAGAILTLFQGFPLALVGAMMIVVGIELGKFSQRVSLEGLPVLVITVLAGLIWHMGVGFACGIAAAWFQQRFRNNTEEFAQGEGRSDG